MKLPLEAVKHPHGIGFLAGAAVSFAIAGALFVSTVRRYLHDWSVDEAVRAFHQSDGQAAQAFASMRTDRPLDPLPRLFLGAWEVDRADLDPARLDVAEKLFDEAWQLQPEQQAGVGRLVVRLRRAAARAAAQRPAAAASAEELVRDVDPSHPDVLPLRAAIAVLRRQPDEARKLLEAAPSSVPSYQALGAWHWNRAVARILCKDGRALDDALLAFQLRQWPDPEPATPVPGEPPQPPGPRADAGRLLALAYRVSLADPAAQGAKDFPARCARALKALEQAQGLGRYSPPFAEDRAAAWNALGLGFMKVSRAADAVTAFAAAAQTAPGEPAYSFNLAAANRLLADSLPADKEVEKKQAMQAAGTAYAAVVDYLAQDEERLKGREDTMLLAMQSACATYVDGGLIDAARKTYMTYAEKVPSEAQRNRDLGALFDWAGDGSGALEYYKKAIELGHKDAAAMQRRVRFLESGQ